jgi:hypothetical protein
VTIDAAALAALPEAVASRLLWRAYQGLRGSRGVLTSRHARELLALVRSGPGGPASEVHLPGRVRARREAGRICFEFHNPRPGKEK